MNEISTTNTLLEGEKELVARALGGDGASLRVLLTRYTPPVFSYILNLSGSARDAAYDKTVDLLASCLAARRTENSEWFLVDCLRSSLAAARTLPARAAFEMTSSAERVTPERAASRRFLKEALERLTFEDKSFLLLRDQLCLPYAVIAQVLQTPEREARVRVERARLSLRDSLETILRNKEGGR